MLYAITDRRLYGSNEAHARRCLLEQAAVWAANGVAFVQLREKDLSARGLVELARAMLQAVRSVEHTTTRLLVPRLLINGRPDVALAAGAAGVHLPSGPGELTPSEVQSIFAAAGRTDPPTISVSCHTLLEVEAARDQRAECILFGPVFEKLICSEKNQEEDRTQTIPGTGLRLLEQACQLASPTPVFALGGMTVENAGQCFEACAAGIAAIRLLQQPADAWAHLN